MPLDLNLTSPLSADPLRSNLFLFWTLFLLVFYILRKPKISAFPTCCDSWDSRCLQLWGSASYAAIVAATSTMRAGYSCYIVKWAELKVQHFFCSDFLSFPFFNAIWKACVSDTDSGRPAEHQVWLKLEHQLMTGKCTLEMCMFRVSTKLRLLTEQEL